MPVGAVERGIDGCLGGWIAVDLIDGRFAGARFSETIAPLLEGAAVIGIDMPIGLTSGRRLVDVAAQRALGPRRASLFFAPPRQALSATTFAEANRITVARTGKGTSQQSFRLMPKIRELDVHKDDLRLHEVHPELSFAAMAGEALAHGKKTWNGQAQRRALLAHEGIALPDRLGGAADGVPPDDVLDAAGCAWTAHRIANGIARCVPDPPTERDGTRVLAIWA